MIKLRHNEAKKIFEGIPGGGYSDDSGDWKEKLDQAINKVKLEKDKRHKKRENSPIKVVVVEKRAQTTMKKPNNKI